MHNLAGFFASKRCARVMRQAMTCLGIANSGFKASLPPWPVGNGRSMS